MANDEKLDRLEKMVGRINAQQNVLLLTLISLLSEEISAELLERLKERQLAVALQTHAPDEYIEAVSDAFDKLITALNKRPSI